MSGAPTPTNPPSSGPEGSASSPDRPVVRRRSDRAGLYAIIAIEAVIIVILAVGAGAGWFGAKTSSTASCPTGVTLQGAGAAFPSSIESYWGSQFATQTSNQASYAASGAGAGITDLTDKQVDFALTDEGLNSSEASALTTAVGTFFTIPVVAGAVSIVYNIAGYPSTAPLNLTPTELAGIFNGTITSWGDTSLVANNPGLSGSSVSIVTVHRADAAGMSYVLTNLLSDDNAPWATDVGTSIQPTWPTTPIELSPTGNSALITDVSGNNGAIGYTDLYDAEAHHLPSALIVNYAGNPTAPSVASITAALTDIFAANGASYYPAITASWTDVSWVNGQGASDYPLTAVVYLLVPEDPAKGHTASSLDATVLRQWIDWILTTGQTFNSGSYPFADPPSQLTNEALGALGTFNFNGGAIPVC